ncbi:hypothetical protein LS73_000235 [Helicobacter muridarum]|uniref:Uncharacterized protein n=1 Tax=Helicobacter muridarum TaxID=216 RepID=A0A099TV11_9HELI|nr:hypothetical protein [Helicobacter muridarum]TLE01609.1 hypothetical protein LS73_000235 [Helicobacter muridarum]STQ86223.1 Uncharacterised protein [Helicobacter muridarum]
MVLDKNKHSDFYVDLPMVFSVVKVDELVASANEFYGTNIILPHSGGNFDEKRTFYIYKFTMTKLDNEEMQLKSNASGFETTLVKIGVFASFLEVMNSINTVTIFSSIKEADIFLKAILKVYDDKTKSVFICADSEIDGLE